MAAYPPLTPKDIKDATGKTGSARIPYPDLRKIAETEHAKQSTYVKQGFSPKGVTDPKQLEAARVRGMECHKHRIAVQGAFERAYKRGVADLQKMAANDPLRNALKAIVDDLRTAKQTHQDAITEVSRAFVECEEKLKVIRAQEQMKK